MGLILFDILEEALDSREIFIYLTVEDLEWFLVELDMDRFFEDLLKGYTN